MKVKLTPLYIGTAVVVCLILFSSFFTIGVWLGWWGVVDVYGLIWTFIVNWVIVITFAILGGILFGMFVGFRLLSSQGFTPFERSMLTMFTKVEDIQKRILHVEEELQRLSADLRSGNGGLPGDHGEGELLLSKEPPLGEEPPLSKIPGETLQGKNT